MGMGLIVLVVLVVAGFFLTKKLGLLGFFRTLGNRGRSRFRRSQADGQTVFTVTPARPSLAAVIAIVVGLAMLLNYEMLDIIALVGLLPLVMGVLAVLVGARYRRAATITVAEEAVSCSGRTWSFDEIADINIRLGSRVNADEPAIVTLRAPDGGLIYGSKSTSAMLSRVLNRRMIERSYLVSLRSRAGSDETVLSGGLTLDCAEALQRDLRAAIAANAGPLVGDAAR